MPDETVVAALAALGQPTEIDAVQLAGSMSHSGVYKFASTTGTQC